MRAHDAPAALGRDRWIPWTFVAAFAVIFLANSLLVYFALSTWKGVGIDGAYERGLAYNDVIAAAERQDATGWRIDVRFASAGVGTRAGTVTMALRDREGLPLAGAVIDGRLVRPLDNSPPLPLDIADRGGGNFEAPIAASMPGQWEFRFAIRRGGEQVEEARRLFVP